MLLPRSLCPRTPELALLMQTIGAARHACLPGSRYFSEGHVTVLDNILLWAIVQPFPMNIFNLD